jgi:hypothetical protein
MRSVKPGILILLVWVACPSLTVLAQRKTVPVCRSTTFAALKPLPKLEYECPEDLIESDEQILKTPDRLAALGEIAAELEGFTSPAWWRAGVAELNACEIHGRAGALDSDERARLKQGDFRSSLFGNQQMRLVLLADPCYQPGYNGSVAFLLYWDGGKVFVSKILDGYYSRVDNSVGLDFANLNGRQIIEISTGNSMPPAIVNFYYVIDPNTHRAVPTKIFKEGKVLTNEVRSAMILGEPHELELPAGAEDTVIIRAHRLLPRIIIYSEVYPDGGGRKLSRTVYHWNGRYYSSTRK